MSRLLLAFTVVAAAWGSPDSAATEAVSWEDAPAAAREVVAGNKGILKGGLQGPEKPIDAAAVEESGAESAEDLPRFARVSPGIYRSGQPKRAAYPGLKALGIKTLLDLRQEPDEIEVEEAARLGIALESVPMNGVTLPTYEQVDRALAVLADPSKRPVLVHCRQGKDRTGVVVAAYRVAVEWMDPEAAAEEAYRFQCCGPLFKDLRRYLSGYAQYRAKLPAPALQGEDPSEIPGSGQGLSCVEFGLHTQRIPPYDPVYHGCVTDALAGPGEFEAAFEALKRKIRAGGGPLIPVWGGNPFSPEKDELQQGLGKGNLKMEAFDEARHWGDAVYLQMKPEAQEPRPVAFFAVTYRTYKVTDRQGATLMAERVDFVANGEGRLDSVHLWSGVRLEGAPSMAWAPGPSRTVNDPQSLEGLWGRRWRQLVKNWTAP